MIETPEGNTAMRVPYLENGDHLSRDEFERRYDVTPNLKKAELIEGIVYSPWPPQYRQHARPQAHLVGTLGQYEAGTRGVHCGDNTTVRLDLKNEPQPDALLMVDADRGGQARIGDDDFIEGPPELVAEVVATSASIALHTKFNVYRRNGVREYIVWRTFEGAIDWFVLRGGDFVRLESDSGGILRSAVFPGLWLDSPALLRGDLATVLAVVQQGMASAEHSAFVARLAAKKA